MLFWGIADADLSEVVEFFASRQDAERELRTILRDEPTWAGKLSVVAVDFSAPTPTVISAPS